MAMNTTLAENEHLSPGVAKYIFLNGWDWAKYHTMYIGARVSVKGFLLT